MKAATEVGVDNVTFEIRQHGHRSPFLRVVRVCWDGPSGSERKEPFKFEELHSLVIELLGDLTRRRERPSDSESVERCKQAMVALLALSTEEEVGLMRELFPWSELLKWKDLFTAQNPFAGFDIEQLINCDYFDRLVDLPNPQEEAALIRSLLGFDAFANAPYWLFIAGIQARPEAQKVAYYKLLEVSYASRVNFREIEPLIGALHESYRKESWCRCPLYFY